jgi:hypothetical protein
MSSSIDFTIAEKLLEEAAASNRTYAFEKCSASVVPNAGGFVEPAPGV